MSADSSRKRPITEPAVVAHRLGEIIAVGLEAERMLGRTPSGLDAERAFEGGSVRSPKLAQALIRSFLARVARRSWQRPEIVIALGSGATALDRRALNLLAREAGAARVTFAALPTCRALGLELPIFEPRGTLLIDVGASRTRIDLLSLGRSVQSATLDDAGDSIDEAIARRLREQFNLMVGPRSAQTLKHDLLGGDAQEVSVYGRDLVSGLPRGLAVQRGDLEGPAVQLAERIAQAVQEVLRDVSPELVADVAEGGVYITGGSSRLLALRERLPQLLSLPLHCDESPEESITSGLVRLADRSVGGTTLRKTA